MLFSLSSSVIRSNLSFVILNHLEYLTLTKKEQLINDFCVFIVLYDIDEYKQLTKSFQYLFYFTFHII